MSGVDNYFCTLFLFIFSYLIESPLLHLIEGKQSIVKRNVYGRKNYGLSKLALL